jgi:hypothetical protein
MTSFAAERIAVPTPVVVAPVDPGWMSNPWKVLTTNVFGVATQDTLRLRANGTIEIQKSHSATSTVWAKGCQLTCAGLSGVTVDNRPFLIQLNSATKQVTCTFQHAQSQGTNSQPGPTQTWVAEEGGPNTVQPPPGSPNPGHSHT